MLKLNDGTSVSLEEFNTWHFNKQLAKTRPIEEAKAIIAKTALKNQRSINTPQGQFLSINEALKVVKLSYTALRSHLLNTAYPEYSYVNPKPSDAKKEFYEVYKASRKVVTPLGTFRSKAKAAEAHKLQKGQFGRLMNSDPENYYLLSAGPQKKIEVIKVKKIRPKKEPKKKLTKDERRIISLKVGEKKRREVLTPKGKFISVNEAVKALGITKSALRDLCLNTAYPLYSYVNPTPQDIAKQYHKVYKGGPKKTVTPIGTFATKGLAAKALRVTYDEMSRLIKTQPKKYYYSEETLNIGIRKVIDPALYHPTKGYRLPKEYMTPTGPYPSKLQACKDYGLSAKEFDYLIEKHPKDFYKMKK